jgi:hypothetical protein
MKAPITTVATLFAALLAATVAAFGSPMTPEEALAWKLAGLPDCSLPIGKLSRDDLSTCEGLDHFSRVLREAQLRELMHPSTEDERCYGALPQFRDGCDKRIEAKKRAIHDPGAVSLCPAPRQITANGCR